MKIETFVRQAANDVYPEPRSPIHEHIMKTILPDICSRLDPCSRILDVGCGQGTAMEHFSDAGHIATGIALHAQDVEACRELGLSAFQLDMNFLPDTWTRAFDFVFARHVLEHSLIPLWTLSEISRVLQPDGKLYVEVPAPETSCHHETNRNHYSVLGISAWSHLIQRAGFTVEQAHEMNFETAAGPDKYWSFHAVKKP